MQRPGSHVLFSVWSLSLVVGPAKVPHPLLTSQVLDRLRLGTSGGSLCLWEGGKKGWFDQTLQLDRQPIRSRAEWCCLKIFSQFFSLLCKLNQSLVSDAQWKYISLKLFHFYQTLTSAPSLAMESVQDFTLPWVETAWVEPRGITSMAVRCRT